MPSSSVVKLATSADCRRPRRALPSQYAKARRAPARAGKASCPRRCALRRRPAHGNTASADRSPGAASIALRGPRRVARCQAEAARDEVLIQQREAGSQARDPQRRLHRRRTGLEAHRRLDVPDLRLLLRAQREAQHVHLVAEQAQAEQRQHHRQQVDVAITQARQRCKGRQAYTSRRESCASTSTSRSIGAAAKRTAAASVDRLPAASSSQRACSTRNASSSARPMVIAMRRACD